MKRSYKSNCIVLMLFSVVMVAFGCDSGNRGTNSNNHKKLQTSVLTKQVKTTEDTKLSSFVLSCGSGCAMTYTPESITGKLPVLIVQFKVEMFVDEELTDTYNEVYEFSYNSSKQIEQVHMQGKNDNVLKTLMPNAQRSFRKFAEELLNR
ncbi:hypothetical protein CLV57_1447 [Mucilaginibacter auburnensis]|uniref:Lipoprotein n=2 Tax=Mucilaginibacter auburnensis TaxID=1457233 RepID=A0A2H9VUE3_9SPHI|nr:hypothetical protein CLV57_1447 [Mucilaginibacter auburnensis]